jgi:hypothetical protein
MTQKPRQLICGLELPEWHLVVFHKLQLPLQNTAGFDDGDREL